MSYFGDFFHITFKYLKIISYYIILYPQYLGDMKNPQLVGGLEHDFYLHNSWDYDPI